MFALGGVYGSPFTGVGTVDRRVHRTGDDARDGATALPSPGVPIALERVCGHCFSIRFSTVHRGSLALSLSRERTRFVHCLVSRGERAHFLTRVLHMIANYTIHNTPTTQLLSRKPVDAPANGCVCELNARRAHSSRLRGSRAPGSQHPVGGRQVLERELALQLDRNEAHDAVPGRG